MSWSALKISIEFNIFVCRNEVQSTNIEMDGYDAIVFRASESEVSGAASIVTVCFSVTLLSAIIMFM